MAKTKHYVNNADFLEALINYRTEIELAEKNGEEKPPLPDYIGECFLNCTTIILPTKLYQLCL